MLIKIDDTVYHSDSVIPVHVQKPSKRSAMKAYNKIMQSIPKNKREKLQEELYLLYIYMRLS